MAAEKANKEDRVQVQRRRLGLTTAAASTVTAAIPKLLSMNDAAAAFSSEDSAQPDSATGSTLSSVNSETITSLGIDRHQSQLIMRTASRIGLHMLREDITTQDPPATGQSMPHIQQEHFVINSCKVFVDLSLPETASEGWLFISPKFKQEIIDSIPTTVPFPCTFVDKSYLELYDRLNCSETAKNDAARIVQLIANKKEMGIVASELPQVVGLLNDQSCALEKHISLLIESQTVLRVGVVAQRYVYVQHIDPWVVKSFRLLRSGKDKLEPFNSATMGKTNDDESQQQSHLEQETSLAVEEVQMGETVSVVSDLVSESVNEAATGRRKRKVITYPQSSKKSRTVDSLGTK